MGVLEISDLFVIYMVIILSLIYMINCQKENMVILKSCLADWEPRRIGMSRVLIATLSLLGHKSMRYEF